MVPWQDCEQCRQCRPGVQVTAGPGEIRAELQRNRADYMKWA